MDINQLLSKLKETEVILFENSKLLKKLTVKIENNQHIFCFDKFDEQSKTYVFLCTGEETSELMGVTFIPETYFDYFNAYTNKTNLTKLFKNEHDNDEYTRTSNHD